MDNFPIVVKEKLSSLIDDIASVSWLYCTNPGHSFTRLRKLGFANTMKLIVSMEGGTVDEEMTEFFQFDVDAPTQSAFNQQRSQIKQEAFRQLFLDFTNSFPGQKLYDGYRLLACDGSNIVYSTNPEIVDDYATHTSDDHKGYNQKHLNALYDIVNRVYVDAVIQPGVKQDERLALRQMIDHYETDDPSHTIITVDRGYESYNLIAQMLEKGLSFVFRAKDIHSLNSITSSFMDKYPDCEEFDVTIKRFISRKKSKNVIENKNIYKYMKPDKNFDYLKPGDHPGIYYMNFRIVRIKISDNSYECLITNLPANEFPPERLKEIYHMRWGIETSFRQLKYAVGMLNFHAKKPEYVEQEIFAKLIVHNFSEIIASHASVSKSSHKKNKHNYKLNYSMAAKLCHKFLKLPESTPPFDLIRQIERHLSVDKSYERSFPRPLRGIGAVSFFYRIT